MPATLGAAVQSCGFVRCRQMRAVQLLMIVVGGCCDRRGQVVTSRVQNVLLLTDTHVAVCMHTSHAHAHIQACPLCRPSYLTPFSAFSRN